MNWTPTDTLLEQAELSETPEELTLRERIMRDNEAQFRAFMPANKKNEVLTARKSITNEENNNVTNR